MEWGFEKSKKCKKSLQKIKNGFKKGEKVLNKFKISFKKTF